MKESKGAKEVQNIKTLMENINKNTKSLITEYDNYNYPEGADADPNAPWNQESDPEWNSTTLEIDGDDIVATLKNDKGGYNKIYLLGDLYDEVSDPYDKKFLQTAYNLGGINDAALKSSMNIKNIEDIIEKNININDIDWEYPEGHDEAPLEPDYRDERIGENDDMSGDLGLSITSQATHGSNPQFVFSFSDGKVLKTNRDGRNIESEDEKYKSVISKWFQNRELHPFPEYTKSKNVNEGNSDSLNTLKDFWAVLNYMGDKISVEDSSDLMDRAKQVLSISDIEQLQNHPNAGNFYTDTSQYDAEMGGLSNY